jgi:hypothetical protein
MRTNKKQTKAELIKKIAKKTERIPTRFQPSVKRSFLSGLKYKTKPELERIYQNMRISVDKTGYDIYMS